MIDNKTQVLLPRILLPLVSSTTFHFDSPSSFSSSISSFSSSPCSASLASPFFRFASPVSIWPFSPHCIVAFFYRCGDLFKFPPPSPRSFSSFSLTDPFAFSLLPPSLPFIIAVSSIVFSFFATPFCAMFITLHASRRTYVVSFNATLRFCYVKLYISRALR